MNKHINNFKNFSPKNESFTEGDILKQIEESTDLEYLTELEKFVDMDIANIGKDSDVIKKMKAKMHNTTPEEYDQKQRDGFNMLKTKIQDRIKFLTK